MLHAPAPPPPRARRGSPPPRSCSPSWLCFAPPSPCGGRYAGGGPAPTDAPTRPTLRAASHASANVNEPLAFRAPERRGHARSPTRSSLMTVRHRDPRVSITRVVDDANSNAARATGPYSVSQWTRREWAATCWRWAEGVGDRSIAHLSARDTARARELWHTHAGQMASRVLGSGVHSLCPRV